MKTKEEIERILAEIEADERIEYKAASIMINAPLALEQICLTARADLLRKILGLPLKKYHGKD